MPVIAASGMFGGIIAIVAGVVVIAWPRVIAYVVGIYLIIVGVIAVINALQ